MSLMLILSPVNGSCTFPADAASVAAARWYADGVLRAWNVGDASWTCLQLISGLATKAVIHARTTFTLDMSRDRDRLRVCVPDASTMRPGAAQVRRGRHDRSWPATGRLDGSSWGVQPGPSGKIIWFEIDLAQHHAARAWDTGAEIDLDALLGTFDFDDGDSGAPLASVLEWPLRQALADAA